MRTIFLFVTLIETMRIMNRLKDFVNIFVLLFNEAQRPVSMSKNFNKSIEHKSSTVMSDSLHRHQRTIHVSKLFIYEIFLF